MGYNPLWHEPVVDGRPMSEPLLSITDRRMLRLQLQAIGLNAVTDLCTELRMTSSSPTNTLRNIKDYIYDITTVYVIMSQSTPTKHSPKFTTRPKSVVTDHCAVCKGNHSHCAVAYCCDCACLATSFQLLAPQQLRGLDKHDSEINARVVVTISFRCPGEGPKVLTSNFVYVAVITNFFRLSVP